MLRYGTKSEKEGEKRAHVKGRNLDRHFRWKCHSACDWSSDATSENPNTKLLLVRARPVYLRERKMPPPLLPDVKSRFPQVDARVLKVRQKAGEIFRTMSCRNCSILVIATRIFHRTEAEASDANFCPFSGKINHRSCVFRN